MIEAETAVDSGNRAQQDADPASVNSPFRKDIELRVKTLRSLRAPTVEQIERALFWEEYLKQTIQAARPMQEPASEPVQRR